MKDKKLPLFIFPIGARGDFLISILYGNILKVNWNNDTVNQPTDGSALGCTFFKIHKFGMSDSDGTTNIQPDNLNQYLTFKISLDSPTDLLEISYFAWTKRVKNNIKSEHVPAPVTGSAMLTAQWNQLRTVVSLTEMHVKEFNDYKFDYVIPFSKLKDIDFIRQLYTHINQQELDAEELERIQFNIDLNETLLKNNPYTVDDLLKNMAKPSSKEPDTSQWNIDLKLNKDQIELLLQVLHRSIELNKQNITALSTIEDQIRSIYAGSNPG